MNKGLEALTYFKTLFDIWKEKIAVADDTKEIEEEYEFKPRYELIEKELKALEIIKREPSAIIETVTTYDTWEEYIKDYPISDRTIWHIIKNKSEFDLLKEVLL